MEDERENGSLRPGGARENGARMMRTFHKPSGGSALGTVLLLIPAVLLLLPACAAVGPDYVRPEAASPAAWNTRLDEGLSPKTPDVPTLSQWWMTLEDPILCGLIDQGIARNLDIKTARARIREARAQLTAAGASLWPGVDTAGSATWSQGSENRGGGGTTELYSLGFDASWELDLFGGNRRTAEAASAELEAEEENLRDVLVTLLAEIALNYLDLRTVQARLRVTEENLTAQQETADLAQLRRQAGLTDELAVEQSRYNLESTRSQIPSLRTAIESAKNRLAVLTGSAPGELHRRLDAVEPVPAPPAEIAVGVPAETLRQRPDIRRAERSLAAQTARIGAATADLYPRLRLFGSIGLESLSAGNLFDARSLARSIGPSLSWPLFDAGAIRSNIEVQSALQEQALCQYEATVLGALEEVENALQAYQDELERKRTLARAVEAARKAVELSRIKYEAGLTDFVSVLEAERSHLGFEDQMAQSAGNVAADLVRIYKALGGGWDALASKEARGGNPS